jgi:hypothetical protein
MESSIENIKKYEILTITHDESFDKITKSLGIVRNYIIRNKLILIGGQSIDYAIRSKNNIGIYSKETIPDYDIITDTHFEHAYILALTLYKSGITGISVINALHPSTMKVRVDFQDVCDITYIPKIILDKLPTIWYDRIVLIHPHYQFIDQHRALSYPYENAPLETIMNRPKKDMQRYDELIQLYPLRLLHSVCNEHTMENDIKLITTKIKLNLLNNQCINGFVALNYWIKRAIQLGFKSNYRQSFGKFEVDSGELICQIPQNSHGITLYSNDVAEFCSLVRSNSNNTKSSNTKIYNKFLDKLPQKTLITLDDSTKFEVFDNISYIAAHPLESSDSIHVVNDSIHVVNDSIHVVNDSIHVVNIQCLMMYLLLNYIILEKIQNTKNGFPYYIGYLVCNEMVIWASNLYNKTTTKTTVNKSTIKQFLPTAEIYGTKNISDSYIIARYNFDLKNNQTTSKENKAKYGQPHHVYDRDMIYKKIPKVYMEFNRLNSLVFALDGQKI